MRVSRIPNRMYVCISELIVPVMSNDAEEYSNNCLCYVKPNANVPCLVLPLQSIVAYFIEAVSCSHCP